MIMSHKCKVWSIVHGQVLKIEGDSHMLIGELVIRAGCPRDTIRFYEKVGLIEGKRGRSGTNNYKHYDDQMVDRILLVKQAKILGFTLAEIKEIGRAHV